MKISQTDSQLVATQGGKGNVAAGIIFALIGIIFIIGFSALINSPGVKTTGNPALGYLFGGIFVLIGVLMAVFATNRTVTLNKGGTSTVVNRRVIGAKEADQSFSTSDVTGVSLTTGMPDASAGMNSTGNNRLSTLALLMKDNAIIQVAISNGRTGFSVNGINLSNLIQKAPLSDEAHKIATFLGVPLQEVNATNPIAVVESIVGAVRNPTTQPIESVTTTVPPVIPPAVPMAPVATPVTPVTPPFTAATPTQEPTAPTPPTPTL